MPDEKFKLPNSSYEEITKIIKGYGYFKEPSSLDDVSKLLGMDKTVISRNVGFLVELDILEPGSKKSMTLVGRELAHSLEHEMPDEIRTCWQKIVSENEFISKLVTAIKIRNGMDENTLQSHIAYSAGQPKKPQFMTGARTIIDVLRAAELIKERDGKFIVFSVEDGTSPYSRESLKEITFETNRSKVNQPLQLAPKLDGISATQVRVNINISINCVPDDLGDIGKKLKLLIKNINTDDEDIDIESTEQ